MTFTYELRFRCTCIPKMNFLCQKHRQTDRQTDRQRDGQRDGQTDRQAGRQAGRQRDVAGNITTLHSPVVTTDITSCSISCRSVASSHNHCTEISQQITDSARTVLYQTSNIPRLVTSCHLYQSALLSWQLFHQQTVHTAVLWPLCHTTVSIALSIAFSRSQYYNDNNNSK